jgi:MraZ protein
MFLGTYTPKLDEKNRLFLPAKFREQLAGGLVVTKSQEFCLAVWPLEDFMNEAKRVQRTPVTVRESREYGRFLAMRATEDTPDKQGRITITPQLKEYAGLDREVVVIGALERVEIWNPERLATWEAEQSPKFAEMSEDIFPPAP